MRVQIDRHDCQTHHPILKYLFKLFCFIGCLYQLSVVTLEYQKYKTVTRMRRIISADLAVPNLAVCIKYSDILDLGRLKDDLNISITRKGGELRRISSILTLAQIFNYTPSVDMVVVKCVYPVEGSITLRIDDALECEQHILISKYYIREFMCYRFEVANLSTVRFDHISSSLFNAGRIYTVQLNRLRLIPKTLKLIAFFGAMPYYSDKYALIYHNNEHLYNSFSVSFTLYTMKLLPLPYDTRCMDTGRDHEWAHCVQECLREGLRPFQRFPYSGILLPSDADKDDTFKHLNKIDLMNDSMHHLYNELEHKCQDRCIYDDCNLKFTTTTVTKETGDPKKFVINVMIPVAPAAHIETDAAMSLSDYLIFSFSMLGFWLGISIKNLNPFERLPSARDKEYVRLLERMWRQRFQVASSHTSPQLQSNDQQREGRW